MKRYMLFSGNDYYPDGGARDWIGNFDLVKDGQNAHALMMNRLFYRTHIESYSKTNSWKPMNWL